MAAQHDVCAWPGRQSGHAPMVAAMGRVRRDRLSATSASG
jgi:hypothetical protein